MKSLEATEPMGEDMGSVYMKSPGAAGPMGADMRELKVENEKSSIVVILPEKK